MPDSSAGVKGPVWSWLGAWWVDGFFSGVLRGEGSKGKFSQIISAGPKLTNTLEEKISM